MTMLKYSVAATAASRQRISWFIDTIGSMTASTSTSTIAPITTISAGCTQRREPGEAPLGVALQLRRPRARASAPAARWPRRWRRDGSAPAEIPSAPSARGRATRLRARARAAASRGGAQRQRPDDVARRHRARAAAARRCPSGWRACSRSAPCRWRATSRPATGIRSSERVPARAERGAAIGERERGNSATTMPASHSQPVARKNALIAISACVSHGSVCRLCW